MRRNTTTKSLSNRDPLTEGVSERKDMKPGLTPTELKQYSNIAAWNSIKAFENGDIIVAKFWSNEMKAANNSYIKEYSDLKHEAKAEGLNKAEIIKALYDNEIDLEWVKTLKELGY